MGAGVGSAIGFLQAPIAFEVTRSNVVGLDGFDVAKVNQLLRTMTNDAQAVVAPALGKQKTKITIVADCRYVGQGHEIRIRIPVRAMTKKDGNALKQVFEKTYGTIYGLTIPGQPAEITTWSVTASGPVAKPVLNKTKPRKNTPEPLRNTKLYDAKLGKQVQAPVYWRFDLKPGATIKGPAIIAEHETSSIVGAGFAAHIDGYGNIIMERHA